jgi:hypothetical protein
MRLSIFNILFSFLLFGNAARSQKQEVGFTVKMDGYFINLGGQKIFQPCEDASKAIWKTIDNRAFTLSIDDRNDLYLESIENIGDSVVAEVYDSSEMMYYKVRLSYFYGTLEAIIFFDTEKSDFLKTCKEIFYSKKKYSFNCLFLRNRVKKIIPRNKNDVWLMYKYYKDKGYNVPQWLEKIVHYKK